MSAKSQGVTDTVRVYKPTMDKIMADLDRLEICLVDVENLRLGYTTCKEERLILRNVANTLYINNKELTEQINDVTAKNQRLKRKRITWGIVGIIIGASGYAIFVK